MNESATRYPLSWPAGWKRTPRYERRSAAFRSHGRALSAYESVKRLSGELGRLGASEELLSTNLDTRLDGLPRSGQSEPSDPGAAVYFKLKGKPRCLACDKWTKVADNIAAIAQHIDALRRIDRYGVGTLEQAFAGYTALPASPNDWWMVLGITREATRAQVEDAFRATARRVHPDVGGSHVEMARVNEARDLALEEIGKR